MPAAGPRDPRARGPPSQQGSRDNPAVVLGGRRPPSAQRGHPHILCQRVSSGILTAADWQKPLWTLPGNKGPPSCQRPAMETRRNAHAPNLPPPARPFVHTSPTHSMLIRPCNRPPPPNPRKGSLGASCHDARRSPDVQDLEVHSCGPILRDAGDPETNFQANLDARGTDRTDAQKRVKVVGLDTSFSAAPIDV